MAAAMTARNKQCFALVLAVATLTIIWTMRFLGPNHHVITGKIIPYAKAAYSHISPQQTIRTVDLSRLQKHVKTEDFSYAHRTIRTKLFTGERPTLTKINEPLFGTPLRMSQDDLEGIPLLELEPIELAVPRSPVADTSIMSFSIATGVDRLERADQLLHWLPNTGAQLHVLSPPSDDALTVEHKLREQGLNLTIHNSDLPFPKAYFYGLKELYQARTPNTQWLVLMDDDTFIPSLPYLVDHLNTNYDATKEVMVAAVSDNIDQVKTFGLIPFGGGGIFFSVPLAAALVQDKIWDKCMAIDLNQGDGIVNDCLNHYSATRPSFDPGLNQMDFSGDAGGYFESGRRMLTIHHWKTWYHVDMPMAANISKACGFECVFQRFQFDDNIVLSNGYSIVEYPKGIEDEDADGNKLVDLGKVELTWAGSKGQYEHHIGPLRDRLGKEEKKTMRLVETEVLPGKGVRQTYVERVEDTESVENAFKMDRVVELLWLNP
ncbi:uncharacterized protein PAC_17952 [Phialocephala subalpina]|uniref:Glycosyltransferase family 31 protein n=1 Tax=Phialocephala subalpina TaxID=576137 RepID=A0A1L7XSP9_9HELO|nr:uncharacterized protein PAC_17952 [Phialocephala subalpina]